MLGPLDHDHDHDHDGACCSSCAVGKACESTCPDFTGDGQIDPVILDAGKENVDLELDKHATLDAGRSDRAVSPLVHQVNAYFDGKPWEFNVNAPGRPFQTLAVKLLNWPSPPIGFRPVIDKVAVRSGVTGAIYLPVLVEFGWAPIGTKASEILATPVDLDLQREFSSTITNDVLFSRGGVAGGLRVPRDPQSGEFLPFYMKLGDVASPIPAEVNVTVDPKWVRTEHCFPVDVQRDL